MGFMVQKLHHKAHFRPVDGRVIGLVGRRQSVAGGPLAARRGLGRACVAPGEITSAG